MVTASWNSDHTHGEPGRGRRPGVAAGRGGPPETPGPGGVLPATSRPAAAGQTDGSPRSSRMAATASRTSNAASRSGRSRTCGGCGGDRPGGGLVAHQPAPQVADQPSAPVAARRPGPARGSSREPGLRRGGSSPSGSRPAVASSQATRLLEFHMSPSPRSSRPQVSAGTRATCASTRAAVAVVVGEAPRTLNRPSHVGDPAPWPAADLVPEGAQPAERSKPDRPYDDHAPAPDPCSTRPGPSR